MDDVVIISALRTPITKAKRGGLKDTPPDDLLLAVMTATLQRTGIDPADIGDIVIGSVLGDSSQRAIQCRIASLLAGIPDTVPVHTVNRQCSSGLQAIASVAAAIKAGYYSVGLAGGVESMSTNPMAWEGGINPRIADNEAAQSFLLPMGAWAAVGRAGGKGRRGQGRVHAALGRLSTSNSKHFFAHKTHDTGITSENVAERYGIDRATQDALAVRSHARAAAARASGRFKDEIVPVETTVKDPKTGEEMRVVVSEDDGIRPGVTTQALGGLKAVFKKGGSTTAGNSSQVTKDAWTMEGGLA